MSDKTEPPTPKRLQDARRQGQIPRSQEVNTALIILSAAWLLSNPGRQLIEGIMSLMEDIFGGLEPYDMTMEFVQSTFLDIFLKLALPFGLILVGFLLVGVIATLAQIGYMWANERLKFDLARLNPINGIKRLFSISGIFEFAKAVFKLILVGYVAYAYLAPRIEDLLMIGLVPINEGMSMWTQMAVDLAFRIGGTYLVIAAADYAYQRWNVMRNLKMTKEEVKEEFKQREGNPIIKRQLRQKQRQMAMRRMMASVPTADVIVTNPTHLAIAIEYKAENMSAPKVVAKGAYKLAERIVKLAEEGNVPVVQNIPLARAMYRNVEIDQEIPPELYKAMAEVLAHVYKLKNPTRKVLN